MPAKTLLLVEDNESLLAAVARQLADRGYHVVPYARFEDARRYLATGTPDMLVTDVRLGPYNGLHLVVMARDKSPDMRIIVYSAHFDPALRDEAVRYGAVFMEKPSRLEDIGRALE